MYLFKKIQRKLRRSLILLQASGSFTDWKKPNSMLHNSRSFKLVRAMELVENEAAKKVLKRKMELGANEAQREAQREAPAIDYTP